MYPRTCLGHSVAVYRESRVNRNTEHLCTSILCGKIKCKNYKIYKLAAIEHNNMDTMVIIIFIRY